MTDIQDPNVLTSPRVSINQVGSSVYGIEQIKKEALNVWHTLPYNPRTYFLACDAESISSNVCLMQGRIYSNGKNINNWAAVYKTCCSR